MNKLVHQTKLFLRRNGSTILTVAGGVGVIATSVMAVKATPKALMVLEDAREEKGEDLTVFEKIDVAGPAYIPAVLTGTATIACIFGANMLNKRQQTYLMSAYALLDSSYKEYKNKVDELYGEGAHDKVVGEIAKDQYKEELRPEDGEILFFDEFSGRYFHSTIEKVQRAQYRLNRDLFMRGYVYLNEFYEHLGMEPVDPGYELGWSEGGNLERYWQAWIDFSSNKTLIDDDLECYIITMFEEPYPDFGDYS